MTTPSPAPLPETSRRTLFRAAAVGGAALWAVPAVQVLSLTTSSAAAASTTTDTQDLGASAPLLLVSGTAPASGLLVLREGQQLYGFSLSTAGVGHFGDLPLDLSLPLQRSNANNTAAGGGSKGVRERWQALKGGLSAVNGVLGASSTFGGTNALVVTNTTGLVVVWAVTTGTTTSATTVGGTTYFVS